MDKLPQLLADVVLEDDQLDKTITDPALGLEIGLLAAQASRGRTRTDFRPNIERTPAPVYTEELGSKIQWLVERQVRNLVLERGFLFCHELVGASETHRAALDKIIDETTGLDCFWRYQSAGF